MPQFNPDEVKMWFKNFGMDASPEEVAQFTGVDYIGGGSAIANYVSTKKAQAERQANDPMNKVLEAQRTFVSAQEALAKGDREAAASLYDQLGGVLKEAPQLFGNMTPDQIDQYIAPLSRQFKEADAVTQTGAAARGIPGSSIEANAREEQNRIYKENLLSTGLTVGMTQQQNRAKAIQDEINRRSGLTVTGTNAQAAGLGLESGAAAHLSTLAANDQALLSSLPLYLRSYVAQALAAERAAQEKKKGILGVMSDISTGMDLGQNIISLGGHNQAGRLMGGTPASGSGADAGAAYSIAGNMGGGAGISSTASGGGPAALALL